MVSVRLDDNDDDKYHLFFMQKYIYIYIYMYINMYAWQTGL